MFPCLTPLGPEVELNEGSPLRFARLALEFHPCFERCAIAFDCVALDAGTDNVFPICRATPISGDDVVQIEVATIKAFATVLAGIFVAGEDVVTGEFDLFLGEAVVADQKDDLRDPDA